MVDSNPLISIIVPLYNSGQYLGECLNSILKQKYTNIEIIIIDDGSTDNSLDIAKKFSEIDSRVKVRSQSNRGVSAARNLGISIAEGSYIGFVDSDDSVHEDMYLQLLSRIVKDKTDMAVLQEYVVRQGSVADDRAGWISSKEALSKLLLFNFPTSLWAYLYKSETIKSMTLDEDIHFFEDFLFNFKAVSKVKNISILNGDYYRYRIHSSSTNAQGITRKRLTCLGIADRVSGVIDQNANLEVLRSNLIFTRAHFIVGVLTPLRFGSDKKCIEVLRSVLNDKFVKIIFSKCVPIKYKLYLAVARIDIRISVLLNILRAYIKGE